MQVKFHWAAKEKSPLETSAFEVKIGGNVVHKIVPTDYKLHGEILDFNVTVSGSQWLEFCGAGPSDGQGVAIDNVEFGNFKECVDFSTLKY